MVIPVISNAMQVGIDKAFSVIDELMELLYVENRPLYESVMRKIEYGN